MIVILATPFLRAGDFAILGGKVLTMASGVESSGVHEGAVVLVKGRKIEAVIASPPPDYRPPEGSELIDARERWVLPGFIELHSHIGGTDINDMVYPINSGLRTLDNVVPENPKLKKAQAGGVTTVLFIPGSGTNLSGFGTLMKTAGTSPDEVVVRFPGALKIAQGGNPERQGGDLGHGHLGMNWLIRNALQEGKAYTEAWDAFEAGRASSPPPRNPRLELFRGLFHREYPVVVHTQGYNLIQSTLRILHDEMKLHVVIDHGTFDGHELAPEVAARGVQVFNGPRELRFDERRGGFRGLAYEWYKGGVKDVSVNTDAPVVPGEELIYQATMAVRLGLDADAALRGLTVHAARALGVSDRLGSLEAGKDADIVVWSGDPLDVRSFVVLTMVNGKIAYDARKEPRRI
jgi:imidazolonepropionase-like amidohydrolase